MVGGGGGGCCDFSNESIGYSDKNNNKFRIIQVLYLAKRVLVIIIK